MQLYVHIPFCRQKCAYCAFVSSTIDSEDTVLSYLTALNVEIANAGRKYNRARIDTVYIGGGTPTCLSAEQLSSLLSSIKSNFNLSPDAEITVEGNPESITEEKLQALRSAGVNRLSIGIQSLFDDNLSAIGRVHDVKTALSALELASKYFDNLSGDLILGLPYDDNERIREEITMLAPYVKHVSVYLLSVEDYTPLYYKVNCDGMYLPDDDMQIDFLHVATDELQKLGFERYEFSNYSRPGYCSLHNSGYWKREEYLGLGLNASSLVRTSDGISPLEHELRYVNPSVFSEYERNVKYAYPLPSANKSSLSADDIREEIIMLGLRLPNGINKSLLEDKAELLNGKFAPFVKENGGRIALNDAGMDIMNFILSELI